MYQKKKKFSEKTKFKDHRKTDYCDLSDNIIQVVQNYTK